MCAFLPQVGTSQVRRTPTTPCLLPYSTKQPNTPIIAFAGGVPFSSSSSFAAGGGGDGAIESGCLDCVFVQEVTNWLDDMNVSWKQVPLFQNVKQVQQRRNNHSNEPLFLAIDTTNATTTTKEDYHDESQHQQQQQHVVNLAIHLLPTPQKLQDCVSPALCKTMTDIVLQQQQQQQEKSFMEDQNNNTGNNNNDIPQQLIHLHQDVWNEKRQIVQCRLLSRLGSTKSRVFARNTHAKRIDALTAMDFLQQHHLWGATKAKYYYGLFAKPSKNNKDQLWNKTSHPQKITEKEDPPPILVAVATFSNRRKVIRNGKIHKSHELVRLCARRDGVVVGGITKLIKAFVKDVQPDDIVTVVDRDWGSGSGWNNIGFETVHIMPPIIMAIDNNIDDDDDGTSTHSHPSGYDHSEIVPKRRHLVGAGIRSSSSSSSSNNNNDDSSSSSTPQPKGGRLGLPLEALDALDKIPDSSEATAALECLSQYGFYPVYDTGVERLMLLVVPPNDDDDHSNNAIAITKATKGIAGDDNESSCIQSLWKSSVPTYASSYYSKNSGIASLLRSAEDDCC